MEGALATLEDEVRSKLVFVPLVVGEEMDGKSLQRCTPFEKCTLSLAERLALCEALSSDAAFDRGMGSVVGMAVGDAVGAPLEFIDATDPGHAESSYSREANAYQRPFNKFRLQPGQWTDDASMGLCLADSLLSMSGFDGSDVRVRFWSWWFRGCNNAFRKDFDRHGSVGLGGNISRSLYSMQAGEPVSAIFLSQGADAGNGSLMRLAPVPLAHRTSAAAAARVAAASSLTTHPGPIAAEACAFLATLLVRAMAEFRTTDTAESARAFLERVADEYVATELGAGQEGGSRPGTAELARVLRSAEADGLERCWNWRAASLEVRATLAARGSTYNGYPNARGYFGSFCLDGLAIALHSVAATDSFGGAIELCVNHLGDADSTAAICGQIVGALYGWRSIDARWKSQLHRWDDAEIALRAALLTAKPVVTASDSDSVVAAPPA